MKAPIKLSASGKNPINHLSNTPKEYSIFNKAREEINRENYLRNAEKIRQARRERYARQKEQAKTNIGKYSEASDFQVLISLKEYTELNQAKRKNWLNFVWTYKDLNEKEQLPRISNIIEVMRLRELAENLISDYWHTAKNEIKKGKSWNSLEQEKKNRLTKYWARQQAREERGIKEAVEDLEVNNYEKAIELVKFHEERGKVNCPCYDCENKKEIKAKINKEIEEQEGEKVKGKCCVCGKVRKLGEEGNCKSCESQLE